VQVTGQPEKAKPAQKQKHRSKGRYYYARKNQPFAELPGPEFHH
jgi:hypothetical protein